MDDSVSAPHFLKPLLRTPFHRRARPLCQVEEFIAWAGYSTVDVFTTMEQEYFAIRNAATLYDLTPMVKYRIAGPDALDYLNRLITRDVTKLKVGRVAYCIWCDDAGLLIDDGTLFRLSEREFRLCTAMRQIDWLAAAAIGFDVVVEEVTEQVAALALQGPTSASVLRAAGLDAAMRLKPFEIGHFEAGAAPVMISRTGYTGDLGYELWMNPEDAEAVWDLLMTAGRTWGLRPIGSRALNVARLEAGFLSPNVDFLSALHTIRVGTGRNPFELGLDWLLDFGKGHFNGRRALERVRRAGPAVRLVGLDIDGNKPAHDALIYAGASARRRLGAVTSAVWSPTCKRNIALAIVDASHAALGSTVWVEIYLNRELVWERRMARARVVDRVFFAPERRRATPPADF
ncbi:MAG: aminomethyltransferase family protein [Gammaproteobacteria bacterium]|nr:aminomethyltransferase family protein [Gammaproteobacteria bacterium]